MGRLDLRDPPNENRCVTTKFLDELYAKAHRLRMLELYLQELDRDSEFRCSIGGFDEWLSEKNSDCDASCG